MCQVTTQISRPESVDLGKLTEAYQRFYQGSPWNEHVICPVCKEEDDYGPSHSWGVGEAPVECPGCGCQLVPYWSSARLSRYFALQPDTVGIVVRVGDDVAAWAWGYPLSTTDFYIDVVGILEGYRKDPGLRCFMDQFLFFMRHLQSQGYLQVKTRTHNQAKGVRYILSILGFTMGEASTEDQERSYWSAIITELLA